jgi:hypothetical protein
VNALTSNGEEPNWLRAPVHHIGQPGESTPDISMPGEISQKAITTRTCFGKNAEFPQNLLV